MTMKSFNIHRTFPLQKTFFYIGKKGSLDNRILLKGYSTFFLEIGSFYHSLRVK